MRAITNILLLSLVAVGLLAAPLALASGPGSGEEHRDGARARGEEHRSNATASDDHRANASERAQRNVTSDRANVTAARAAWRENATAVRESWHENATAIRERCHAAELDHANATKEQRTANAQCIKSGYEAWRDANLARLQALKDAFLAFLGAKRSAA